MRPEPLEDWRTLGQLALLCQCGRTVELKRFGCCRSCYDRRQHSLRFFGGLRERVIRRDGFRCRACGATRGCWFIIAPPTTRSPRSSPCASSVTCASIDGDGFVIRCRLRWCSSGASCTLALRFNCNYPWRRHLKLEGK